jgi:predicted Zn-dependent protease
MLSEQAGSLGTPEGATGLATGAKQAYEKLQDLRKDLTPENEYYVGRAVATNILARHQYRYRNQEAIAMGRLEGLTDYVNQVGSLVAAAALETPRDGDRPAPLAGFHFTVVESDEINAFAAPGGYVFVTAGAVRTAQSEDELAAVLAHEVAHVVRGHALGSIKKSRYANVSKDALKQSGALDATQLGQLTDLLEKGIDDMVDAFFVKGYSRDTEFEADQVGLAILLRAGYEPRALVGFLETLRRRQATGSGGFFQTHPPAADRIAKLGDRLAAQGAARRPAPRARVERFLLALRELRG